MLVCGPVETYYRCRAVMPVDESRPFLRRELIALNVITRVNARLGARYVVLSNYLADVVRGHGTHRPVHVVPIYGVDTKVFCPISEPKSVTKMRCGLPTTGCVIFFSSGIAPRKT